MNCLVTGASGFIGRHLVKALREQGHSVTTMDTRSSGAEWLWNITSGPLKINERVDISRPDWIFHLAAVSRTPPAIENPVECFRTNVMGSVNVLETARLCGAKRVVMASSNIIYAAHTPYWASKHGMEYAAESYRSTYGLSVICLRFSNVYGPGIPKGDPAVFASLRDCFLEKGHIEITGDGEQSRDFTHVSDIVRGMLMAAESDHCGNLDLCTGRQITLNQAARRFNCPVRYVAERRGDIKEILQDPGPALRILGWTASIPFERGFQDVWEVG